MQILSRLIPKYFVIKLALRIYLKTKDFIFLGNHFVYYVIFRNLNLDQ